MAEFGDLTFNEQIYDAMVRHQIGLLSFSGSVRNEIWSLLDASEDDLRRQIEDRLRRLIGKPLTPARMQRVQRALVALRETRLRAWSDVNEKWFEELRGLALAEPHFLAGILETSIPVELALEIPAASELRNIVTAEPFMGATLKQWADGEARSDIERIQQQIRMGLTQQENLQQITSRVVGTIAASGTNGVTATTRRNAESITRTAVNGIASSARKKLYKKNKKLLDGVLFVATLDSKTTPICRSLDGTVYEDVDDAPDMPLHWGERSLLSPFVNGEVIGERPMRNFTERSLLREWAKKEGLDKAPLKRDQLPRGTKGAFDTWAKKRMRELTGRVPAKTTYQQWLKRQSAKNQDDILGPTRGALFRRGGLSLEKFVARDGSVLTLAQLKRKYADAFRAAGLDPRDF